MTTDPPWVHRTEHVLLADPTRVVTELFLPGQEPSAPGGSRSAGVVDRVLALPDDAVETRLASLEESFRGRHRDLVGTWDAHFALVRHRVEDARALSPARRRLVGATFTQEYAIEGAALLNPSMAPHPDQSGLAAGATRFVMTLRAVGEGHVSSVELRTGVVGPDDVVTLDPPPTVCVTASPHPATFSRAAFGHQLREHEGGPEAGADDDFVLGRLPATFTGPDLDHALRRLEEQSLTRGPTGSTAARFRRVAADTYAVTFPEDSEPQERVLRPGSPSESHGIEDARLVRFVGPDGAVEHLATTTSYDGRTVRLALWRTGDLRTWSTTLLSGPGARNKGLALFPRQVGGRYVALSRADRESNAVTTSADLHHWVHPVQVQAPRAAWEVVQLGNCGPPVETEEGWLVLTHGVGPMRTYSLGALLLDLDDPTRVVGRLEQPLLTPTEDERSGYVPNVVYSCGAMRHGRTLVLPYGCSDSRTRIALVDLDPLLAALRR